MHETFSVNPVNGSASLSVPVFEVAPNTAFSPELFLRYDSRWGNGPFGVGWRVPLPSISRKTESGSPRYQDDDDPDLFVASDAGELVPLLDRFGRRTKHPASGAGATYSVHDYLARNEGPYTSIQRFRDDATGETHWRTLSRDNITSVYASTPQSRIFDPADPSRVFAWLLDFSYDSSGNVITYEYLAENWAGVETSAGEQGRQVTANRYLKRVKYDFVTPYVAAAGGAVPTDWRFQLLFDYGEHCNQSPGLRTEAEWPARLDPFSSYRAGFEVRTHRLCRRVLHFYREAWTTARSLPALKLLGATNLEYTQGPAASFLRSVTRDSLPPLHFDYSEMVVDSATRSFQSGILASGQTSTEYRVNSANHSVLGTRYLVPGAKRHPKLLSADHERAMFLADMSGDGLADLVSVRNGEICYWPNLGRGRFGNKITMTGAPIFDDPARFDPQRVRMADIDGSGASDLVYLSGEAIAFWFNQSGNGWSSPHELPPLPAPIDSEMSQVSVLDLLGSGTACIAWQLPSTESNTPGTRYSVLGTRYSQYIDLMGGQMPRLLVRIKNNTDTEIRLSYGTICVYPSEAWQTGTPMCPAACPVQVVERIERLDYKRNTRTAESYEYHDGYIDPDGGDFLGFGMVERWDTGWLLSGREQLAAFLDEDKPRDRPIAYTRTWYGPIAIRMASADRRPSTANRTAMSAYHNRTAIMYGTPPRQLGGKGRAGESDPGPAAALLETREQHPLNEEELHDASIALGGCMVRQEVYAGDADETALPQKITGYCYKLRMIQPMGHNRHAVFRYERETVDE